MGATALAPAPAAVPETIGDWREKLHAALTELGLTFTADAVEHAEITENGADAHIDKMAKKYLGADKYPYRQPSEVRVIYKIQPERVSTMG